MHQLILATRVVSVGPEVWFPSSTGPRRRWVRATALGAHLQATGCVKQALCFQGTVTLWWGSSHGGHSGALSDHTQSGAASSLLPPLSFKSLSCFGLDLRSLTGQVSSPSLCFSRQKTDFTPVSVFLGGFNGSNRQAQ